MEPVWITQLASKSHVQVSKGRHKSLAVRTGRRDVQLVSKWLIAAWCALEIPSKIPDCGGWMPKPTQSMSLKITTPQEKTRSRIKTTDLMYLTRDATVSWAVWAAEGVYDQTVRPSTTQSCGCTNFSTNKRAANSSHEIRTSPSAWSLKEKTKSTSGLTTSSGKLKASGILRQRSIHPNGRPSTQSSPTCNGRTKGVESGSSSSSWEMPETRVPRRCPIAKWRSLSLSTSCSDARWCCRNCWQTCTNSSDLWAWANVAFRSATSFKKANQSSKGSSRSTTARWLLMCCTRKQLAGIPSKKPETRSHKSSFVSKEV